MLSKVEFLTVFPTYAQMEVVKKTLPTIIAETKRNNAALIVHDSTELQHGQLEKWRYLRALSQEHGFFLILSSNMSIGHVRNMCLQLGQDLYAPDYICMLEDDHGFQKGLIPDVIAATKKYYGKVSPNGLRYGMFTGCGTHRNTKRKILQDGHACPMEGLPCAIGGTNNCFRCAPTSHWNSVLKGYDTDKYVISPYQTASVNIRNYNKGFTTLIVNNGSKVFYVENKGRGVTAKGGRRWDEKYTASDPRAKYVKE